MSSSLSPWQYELLAQSTPLARKLKIATNLQNSLQTCTTKRDISCISENCGFGNNCAKIVTTSASNPGANCASKGASKGDACESLRNSVLTAGNAFNASTSSEHNTLTNASFRISITNNIINNTSSTKTYNETRTFTNNGDKSSSKIASAEVLATSITSCTVSNAYRPPLPPKPAALYNRLLDKRNDNNNYKKEMLDKKGNKYYYSNSNNELNQEMSTSAPGLARRVSLMRLYGSTPSLVSEVCSEQKEGADDISYGPGFVSRLKSRYLHVANKNSKGNRSNNDKNVSNKSHDNMNNKDMSNKDMSNKDMSNKNMSNKDMSNKNKSHDNMSNKDISNKDMSNRGSKESSDYSDSKENKENLSEEYNDKNVMHKDNRMNDVSKLEKECHEMPTVHIVKETCKLFESNINSTDTINNPRRISQKSSFFSARPSVATKPIIFLPAKKKGQNTTAINKSINNTASITTSLVDGGSNRERQVGVIRPTFVNNHGFGAPEGNQQNIFSAKTSDNKRVRQVSKTFINANNEVLADFKGFAESEGLNKGQGERKRTSLLIRKFDCSSNFDNKAKCAASPIANSFKNEIAETTESTMSTTTTINTASVEARASAPSSTVFNFVHTDRNVNHIVDDNTQSSFTVSSDEDSDIDVHRPVSPCTAIFVGANARTGKKSSIRSKKRNNRKLKLSFSATLIRVHEYDRHRHLSDDNKHNNKEFNKYNNDEDNKNIKYNNDEDHAKDENKGPRNNVIIDGSSTLASYTPSRLGSVATGFQLGITPSSSLESSKRSKLSLSSDEDTSPLSSWSTGSSSSDLLF